jgi:hypothetical protein
MSSEELERFFGWLVDHRIAGEGYNPKVLVHDFLYQKKFEEAH